MGCTECQDQLVELLYDEADPATARAVRAHVASCASCRSELAALRSVRSKLKAWDLPARPMARRWQAPPRWVWHAAAAATVVLALGGAAALSHLALRFERGPLVVQLGRVAQTDMARVVEQQDRQAQEIRVLRAALGERSGGEDGVVLQRVAQLVRESEARQRQALSVSLAGLEARTTMQRRYDLARVGASLSYLDGRTGQRIARTTELMGQVLKVSNRREP
jgi:hypothetical protein